MAVLCSVAHGSNFHNAMTFHDGGVAHRHVGRVRGFILGIFFGIRFDVRLMRQGLTGQRTLIYSEGEAVDYTSVGRHFVAGVKHYYVADYHVATGYLLHLSVSCHLDGHIVVDAVEYLKFAVGTDFKAKAYGRG